MLVGCACVLAGLPLDVLHDAHAAGVTAPRDHAHVADLELDGVDRLASLEVDLDRVVHLLGFIYPNNNQPCTYFVCFSH